MKITMQKQTEKASRMTINLPRYDRMCRRLKHDFHRHKTHQPSECGGRRFRLAFRPDKIVAADIHHQDRRHLLLSSRLIFCFDKPSMFAPMEILACHQLSYIVRPAAVERDVLVASYDDLKVMAREVALLV